MCRFHRVVWVLFQRTFQSVRLEALLEASKLTISFLTRELRMRNTSYRELWGNVLLDRLIRCKLYANEVRTRLTIKLLSNLNWNKPF